MTSRRPRRGKRADPPTNPSDLWKVRLSLFGTIGGLLFVVLACLHFVTTRQQAQSVENLVGRWQQEFQLNDEQRTRLKEMELKFHGSGDPFLRPARTLEQTRAHHAAMAELLPSEVRERFLHQVSGERR